MTSETIIKAFRKWYRVVHDEVIKEDEIAFCSSGSEEAFRDLFVDGVYRNDGKILLRNLYNNGKFMNNGTVEAGAYDG